jgi:hypothetical protein
MSCDVGERGRAIAVWWRNDVVFVVYSTHTIDARRNNDTVVNMM